MINNRKENNDNENAIIATRMSKEMFDKLDMNEELQYYDTARIASTHNSKKDIPSRFGNIAVLCAGTSDMPIAEEAAVTLGPSSVQYLF